jgi:histidine ammonia-lyase
MLVAAQAISLRSDIQLGSGTRAAFDVLRAHVPFVEGDTVMAPLLDAVVQLIRSGALLEEVREMLGLDFLSGR